MVHLNDRPFYLTEALKTWVLKKMHSMTTEEKVGQLFCVMGQDYAPEQLKWMVADGKIGGILFRPEPADSIRARFAPLDEVACIPLQKAANLEEGGTGGISNGTLFGWPMLTAATDDEIIVEKFGKVCAVEGRSAGIEWCKKHALDGPRFLNEEPCVFVSLANPYLLQDTPRVKTYINAYTATRAVIETVIDKLMAGGPFTGVSPVDAFCGLPDTRL